MTIKFTRSLGQYLSAPDHDSFTFPAGEFCLGWVMRFEGAMTGDVQSILSNAVFQASGSFNLTYQPSGNTISNRLALFANTASGSALTGSASPGAAGSTWQFILQRDASNVMRLKRCPILAVAPSDGSAVIADGQATLTPAYNGSSGMYIGGRADKASNRMCDQSIGRVFVMPGNLTDLEIARLAYGEDIIDHLGKVVNWYVRLDTIDDIIDRGPAANVFTVTGSPVTSSVQPAYGISPALSAPVISGLPIPAQPLKVGDMGTFTPASVTGYPTPIRTHNWYVDGTNVGPNYVFVQADLNKPAYVSQIETNDEGVDTAESEPLTVTGVAADSITVSPLKSGRLVQRNWPVEINCTYAGVVPTTVEYALYHETNPTILHGWTLIPDATIGAGNIVAKPVLPARLGLYRLAVRTNLATSAIGTETFLVGGLGASLGSSSSQRMFENWSGGGYTSDPLTKRLSSSSLNWLAMSTDGAATVLASSLRQQAGVPIGFLPCGVSGSKLSEWVSKTGAEWSKFVQMLAEAGGKLEFVYVTVGSNDAAGTTWTDVTLHFNRMKTLIANIREATGQPNLPIFWSGSNGRGDLTVSQANFLRTAENMLKGEPFVYCIQTVDLPVRTDDQTHLTAAGFLTSVGVRAAYVIGRKLYGDGLYVDGPTIKAITWQSNTVFYDVDHHNGTDLSPATGGTGLSVISDGSAEALTLISTQRVNATRYSATYSRPLVGPVVARHLSGGNYPALASPIMDNGTTPLPMRVEVTMAAVETAPPAYIRADQALTWAVRNFVRADQPLAYAVRSLVRSDVTLNWLISSGNSVAITPSVARTLKVKVTPGVFEGGSFWNLSDPARPVGPKDPDSVIDITLDWSEVLEDIKDTIKSVEFLVEGLTSAGELINGPLTTILVAAGAGPTSSFTCRITTNSTPPRIEDRTVYLQIGEQ